jgi:hypothetical protein
MQGGIYISHLQMLSRFDNVGESKVNDFQSIISFANQNIFGFQVSVNDLKQSF